MLVAQQRMADAREWLEAGLVVARRQKNSHAASELEAALDGLDNA
jgi:hypothetical protein